MRIFNACVFDGMVQGDVNGQYAYSDPKFDPMLGAAEKLALMVVVEQISGTFKTTGLTVRVQTSPDRRNWVNKNASAEVGVAPTASIDAQAFSGKDDGSAPGFGFNRLRVEITGSAANVSARVRVFATGHAENSYR